MILVLDGAVLAVLLGLATGGKLSALAATRLRLEGVFLLSLTLQATLPSAVPQGVIADSLAVVLFWGLPSVGILIALGANWRSPGLLVAAIGVALNLVVVLLNSGMPVLVSAGASVGFDVSAMAAEIAASWLHLPAIPSTVLVFLADVIPMPGPVWHRGMASLGDLMLVAGVAHYLFARMHSASDESAVSDER